MLGQVKALGGESVGLRRRIRALEQETGIKQPVVCFYTQVAADYYKKLKGGRLIELTAAEFELDSQQELEQGNSVIVDDII